MRWTPLQRLSITSGAALALLGLGGAVSYFYATRLVAADRAVTQTNQNIAAAVRILVGTRDAELATKAYVVRGDSTARRALQAAQASVEDAIDAMRLVSEDNLHQREFLERLVPQVAASFGEFRMTAAIRDRSGADSARSYLMREAPRHEADSLLTIVDGMRNEELRVLAERTRHQSATGTTTLRVILLGTALTFLLAGFALQPMRTDVAARITSSISSSLVAAAIKDDGPEDGRRAVAEDRLRALQAVVAATARARDPSARAHALVDAATAAFSAPFTAVFALAAGGFSVVHASNPGIGTVDPDLARPLAETLRTGAPVIVPSRAARDQQFGTIAGLDALGAAGALLLVPLSLDVTSTGVLMMAFAADREFDDADVAFARTMGLLGGPSLASRSFTS